MKNKKRSPIWGFFFYGCSSSSCRRHGFSEIYFTVSSCSARFRVQMKSETARLCYDMPYSAARTRGVMMATARHLQRSIGIKGSTQPASAGRSAAPEMIIYCAVPAM